MTKCLREKNQIKDRKKLIKHVSHNSIFGPSTQPGNTVLRTSPNGPKQDKNRTISLLVFNLFWLSNISYALDIGKYTKN